MARFGTIAAVDAVEMGAADAPLVSSLDLLVVFAGGVALYLAVRLVRWAFVLVPMGRTRRARWARIGPLTEGVAWVSYLVTALAWTLSGYPLARLAALGLLAVGVVVAVWSVIRDYLAGVVLRTEGSLAVGDVVRVGAVEGTVTRFGGRAVELDLAQGERLVMPYKALGDAAIVRHSGQRAAVRHTFALALPPGLGVDVARDRVRRAALLCHWVPPREDPKIVATGARTLEVTVHALSGARTADVEATIRAALGDA